MEHGCGRYAFSFEVKRQVQMVCRNRKGRPWCPFHKPYHAQSKLQHVILCASVWCTSCYSGSAIVTRWHDLKCGPLADASNTAAEMGVDTTQF